MEGIKVTVWHLKKALMKAVICYLLVPCLTSLNLDPICKTRMPICSLKLLLGHKVHEALWAARNHDSLGSPQVCGVWRPSSLQTMCGNRKTG